MSVTLMVEAPGLSTVQRALAVAGLSTAVISAVSTMVLVAGPGYWLLILVGVLLAAAGGLVIPRSSRLPLELVPLPLAAIIVGLTGFVPVHAIPAVLLSFAVPVKFLERSRPLWLAGLTVAYASAVIAAACLLVWLFGIGGTWVCVLSAVLLTMFHPLDMFSGVRFRSRLGFGTVTRLTARKVVVSTAVLALVLALTCLAVSLAFYLPVYVAGIAVCGALIVWLSHALSDHEQQRQVDDLTAVLLAATSHDHPLDDFCTQIVRLSPSAFGCRSVVLFVTDTAQPAAWYGLHDGTSYSVPVSVDEVFRLVTGGTAGPVRIDPVVSAGRTLGVFAQVGVDPSQTDTSSLTSLRAGLAAGLGSVLAFEQMRLAAQLAQADVRRLTAEQNTRREFMYAIGHELRTPLTVLQGYLQMLDSTDSSAVPDLLTPALDQMGISVERLSSLVDDFLILGQSDDITVSSQILSVAQVTRQLTVALSDYAAVSLTAPDNTDRQAVDVDCALLCRAVRQIVDNAVAASPSGRVQVQVLLADQLTIRVVDCGEGIDPEELPFVTERFFRTRQAMLTRPGAGLGLTVARTIVDAHGGHVNIQSACPGGTTVDICLPLVGTDG